MYGTYGMCGMYGSAVQYGTMEKVKKLTVRVTEEELALWKDAAHIRRVSLSEWSRKVLTATARRTKEEADE